jgi:hypothetical protein
MISCDSSEPGNTNWSLHSTCLWQLWNGERRRSPTVRARTSFTFHRTPVSYRASSFSRPGLHIKDPNSSLEELNHLNFKFNLFPVDLIPSFAPNLKKIDFLGVSDLFVCSVVLFMFHYATLTTSQFIAMNFPQRSSFRFSAHAKILLFFLHAIVIKESEISTEFVKGKAFFGGYDKQGRIICWLRVRLHYASSSDAEITRKMCLWFIERGLQMTKEDVPYANMVFDLSNFSLGNMVRNRKFIAESLYLI